MSFKTLSIALAVMLLHGCASTTPVYLIGKDTYTLTNGLQHVAIKDASRFCAAQNRQLNILRERQLDDAYRSIVLDFQCVAPDSPYTGYDVETVPDITIEKR